MKFYSGLVLLLLQSIYSCSQNIGFDINVNPSSFKTIIPFEIDKRGIVINTYWGSDKINNELLWDNNSPTWANIEVISNNQSIFKSRNYFYSTTTADGTPIKGNVYSCDSISLGQVTFINVPLYEIPDKTKGALGENMISKGIWEINFKDRQIIFASNIDSLKDLGQAKIIPSNFTSHGIKILISFRNNIIEEVGIDFGFNGAIILPIADFMKIEKENHYVLKGDLQFSTPGNKNILEVTEVLDSIGIQKDMFRTTISTNKLFTEKLVGLDFFEQFKFVIFDYINKVFYVSK